MTADENRDEVRMETMDEEKKSVQLKVFKRRWFMLGVICLANLSNAINWICFSSIADHVATYYAISFDRVNWLSLVYMVVSIVFGLASCLLIDLLGIRESIYLGVLFNFVGSLVRIFSLDIWQPDRYFVVLLVGQLLCSLSQPFFMFVTTKFATSWFAENQRGLANTVALGSNVLGTLIGALVSPMLVTKAPEKSGLSELSIMLIIFASLAAVPLIMSVFVRQSLPDLPPSLSSSTSQAKHKENPIVNSRKNKILSSFFNYTKELKSLFSNKNVVVRCVCCGAGVGIFNALTTLTQQIFTVRCYTNDGNSF